MAKRGLFERIARRPSHKPTRPSPAKSGEATGGVTDAVGHGVGKLVDAASSTPGEVPGPSINPATNLIIQDIAMRAGGRMVRHALEKGLLRGRYGGKEAKAIVENRSLVQTLLSGMLARAATRSLPGAALVGGGLLAKTLYDRRKGKRAAKKSGDKSLSRMAKI
jgi:hypothetical protein